MTKIKLYLILFGIVSIIGFIVARFLNNHSFVSDKLITEKDTLISTLGREKVVLKNQIFSIQQDLDICNDNKSNRESVIDKLTKERNEARADAKRNLEAIEHYEQNDLMRFFVKKNKVFGPDCFEEVFKKPDCIKTPKVGESNTNNKLVIENKPYFPLKYNVTFPVIKYLYTKN